MKIIQIISIVIVASVGAVFAQDPNSTSCCPMMGKGGEAMMEWHQQALEKFKAQNAELDRLVQAMNSAQGSQKVDAIAMVINKCMEQRKAWQADMEAHHQKMMDWMRSQPMQSGTSGTMPLASPTVTP